MSYTRNFSKKITLHYSGSASVPAGQTSVNYSGSVSDTVYITIEVDTDSFDKGVHTCKSAVNGLTSSVAATEAAQIAAINQNAEKVGSTIISGFFNTIRLEIDQQIMELNSRIEATFLHLQELKKRCLEKQKQMERDYQSIAGRYLKIFEDLNHELANRIQLLDKPTFLFKEQCDLQQSRTMENDLASTVTVFGREEAALQAQISASLTKKRALETIGKANTFLLKQKQLEETIDKNMLKEQAQGTRYAPVCFIETQSAKNELDKEVFPCELLREQDPKELLSDFQEKAWSNLPQEESNQISRFFNAELNQKYTQGDTHTSRVRERILKLLNFNHIKSL